MDLTTWTQLPVEVREAIVEPLLLYEVEGPRARALQHWKYVQDTTHAVAALVRESQAKHQTRAARSRGQVLARQQQGMMEVSHTARGFIEESTVRLVLYKQLTRPN